MKVLISGKEDEEVEYALEMLKNYSLEVSEEPDLVISVGGDGSVIYAFKKYDLPVLPVRLRSNLGFLSDASFNQLEKVYEKLEKDEYYLKRFLLLDLFKNDERLTSSLNEINLQQKDPRKAARFNIYSNGERLFDFPIISDGVIVSTPIGSTAYNSSIGGYLVNPKYEKIVVTLKAQS
ncbi:MAG: NAD(+)/NADH kinase, partial [Thermoproteota archaeon]